MAKKGITMDPGWPNATAIAVRNGKILSVGSIEDLKPWLFLSKDDKNLSTLGSFSICLCKSPCLMYSSSLTYNTYINQIYTFLVILFQ